MRIKDLLKVEAIELGVSAANKEAAIDKLVALHDKVGNLADVEGYKAAILKRESESTTAIGEGLAVPHAKTAAAKHPGLAAITVPDGVDYDAPDGQPATLLFMIAAPEGAGDAWTSSTSRKTRNILRKNRREWLRRRKSPLSLPPQPPVPLQPLLPQVPASSLSRHARPALLTLTWPPNPLKRKPQRWAFRSRSRPTVPVERRTS